MKEHPETRRMMEDFKPGRITALIFSKLARLDRNTRELLDFADFSREHEAGLICLQESIDTCTPGGRLLYATITRRSQPWPNGSGRRSSPGSRQVFQFGRRSGNQLAG